MPARLLGAAYDVEFNVPARIGDYTDFYTSLDHAINCIRIMYPDMDVTPNFRWMPQAYHGRVSTIGVSGQRFHRPYGQFPPPGETKPVFEPTRRMDYELELGVWIGPGNAMGHRIPLDQVDEHVFGLTLLNDWSVRDIQAWEMAPLGPFHGKNFATTVSPWIVTLDALAPYRTAWTRPAADPQPLPYLESAANRAAGAFDIRLEVSVLTERARNEGRGAARLDRHQLPAPVLDHRPDGGAPHRRRLQPQPGRPDRHRHHLRPRPRRSGRDGRTGRGRTQARAVGRRRRARLPARRRYAGDARLVRKPGAARIGFGECRGTVLPALAE